MQGVLTKATQREARYTPEGGRERCLFCRWYFSTGACGRILGPVAARGWCKYFSRQMVGAYEPGSQPWSPGPSIPPGVALDLNFLSMAPTLDPSVTFTRASTATYFNAAGGIQTAAANVPRFDNNPTTGAALGLLIEEARTNLFAASGNLANATYWTTTNVIATAAAGAAPDGTTSATLMAETSANGFHFLQQLQTVVASTLYSLSVYAKAAGGRYLQLSLDNSSGVGGYATFDLVAGTISGPIAAVGGATIGAASIQPAGNGFYRCAIASTIGANTASRSLLLASNSGTAGWAPSYTGNPANGILLWGAQLEQGAFATSYIPTTTAAVTRSADIATIASIPGRNTAAETFGAEFMAEGITPHNACVIGSSASGLLAMYLDTSAPFGIGAWDGTNATATTTNKIAVMTVAKGASNWTASVGNICLNGGAVLNYSPMTAGFAALTPIKLMGDNAATDTVNGWIRRFRYWPRVLTNSELQQVTT